MCILNEVVAANESAMPLINDPHYAIRRYRNKVYCLLGKQDTWLLDDIYWQRGQKQIVFNQCAVLSQVEALTGIPQHLWDHADVSIKFRKGSEKIKLVGRKGRHTLKKLYQETGIPPWKREGIPLVYIDGQLAAVADYWISADFYSKKKENCYQLSWSEKKTF